METKQFIKSFLLPVTILLLISCDKKIEVIRRLDVESLPTLTTKDFRTEYTDSARKQIVMISPLIESYSNQNPPYSEFRSGIDVLFHDGNKDPVATLSSKYAKYYEDKRLWELKDSVVAINEKNEMLETELLYWDQDKELVYTDRFVRITGEDQIVMGTGLESNPRFTVWRIRNVNATIYLSDEE